MSERISNRVSGGGEERERERVREGWLSTKITESSHDVNFIVS